MAGRARRKHAGTISLQRIARGEDSRLLLQSETALPEDSEPYVFANETSGTFKPWRRDFGFVTSPSLSYAAAASFLHESWLRPLSLVSKPSLQGQDQELVIGWIMLFTLF